MPFMYLGALFSYLDRGNLSYAALQLNSDLGGSLLIPVPSLAEAGGGD